MSGSSSENDRIFRILCARALRRRGEGIPISDNDIDAFESSQKLSDVEKARAIVKLKEMISKAAQEVNAEARGTVVRRQALSAYERLAIARDENEWAAAARGAEGEHPSSELKKRIDDVIDEDDKPKAGDEENGKERKT